MPRLPPEAEGGVSPSLVADLDLIDDLLRQVRDEKIDFDQSRSAMIKLALESSDVLARKLREKGR